MAVQDLWRDRHGNRTARDGRGKRWRVTVAGHPSKAFMVKRDAVAWEAKLIAQGPEAAADGTPVSVLVDSYLAGKANLSDRYVTALRAAAQHVYIRWGDTGAADVDHQDVQEWIAALQAEHGPRRADGTRELHAAAAGTRARVLQVLRGALDIAVKRGGLPTNPCEGVTWGGQQRTDPTFLEVAELLRLSDAAAGVGRDTDRVVVMLLGTCGPRLSEATRFNVGDVDRKRRRLRVRKSKNGMARDIPIPASVLAMLDLDRGAGAPLLISPEGGRLNGDNWRKRVFVKAVMRAGLGELRIHDLRHTAASLMIASGASIKDVQYALGHKRASMTLDLYSHRFDHHLDDVGVRMDRLLG